VGRAIAKKSAPGEKKRDLNAALVQALAAAQAGKWARKTKFFSRRDGSIRRVITRSDGTVEKDHIIPTERALVAAACAAHI
jgi:putative transcriptional regulator